MDGEDTVVVSRAELEELRKLKADLPAILEATREQERKDAITRLHQRDKENPEAAKKRSKKHYMLNKEAVNAKRREAYHKKKAEQAAMTPEGSSDAR
jgi:hypothetical protein